VVHFYFALLVYFTFAFDNNRGSNFLLDNIWKITVVNKDTTRKKEIEKLEKETKELTLILKQLEIEKNEFI
jgi:hypothetical protein